MAAIALLILATALSWLTPASCLKNRVSAISGVLQLLRLKPSSQKLLLPPEMRGRERLGLSSWNPTPLSGLNFGDYMNADKLVTKEFIKILKNKYCGDAQGRTGAELLELAVFRSAVGGSVAAANLLADRCEGRSPEHITVTTERTPEQTMDRIQELCKKLRDPNEETIQ
jgi:hypothetical protein